MLAIKGSNPRRTGKTSNYRGYLIMFFGGCAARTLLLVRVACFGCCFCFTCLSSITSQTVLFLSCDKMPKVTKQVLVPRLAFWYHAMRILAWLMNSDSKFLLIHARKKKATGERRRLRLLQYVRDRKTTNSAIHDCDHDTIGCNYIVSALVAIALLSAMIEGTLIG